MPKQDDPSGPARAHGPFPRRASPGNPRHGSSPGTGSAPDKPHPCPFCGGRAVTERAWADAISVVCTGCGAVGLHQTAKGRDALVQAWNRRKSRVNLQQKSTLQPCPFCASRQLSQGGRGNAIITCRTCGMMTSFATADTRASAARKWNRRV